MNSHRVFRHFRLSVWILVFLFPCFITNIMQAEELPSKSNTQEQKQEEADLLEPPAKSTYEKGTNNLDLIASFDAFYKLSVLEDSDSLSGGSIIALVAPTYRVFDQSLLVFMYDGTYYKKRDFYSDDIGPRERSEYQRHSFTPMLRMDLGEALHHTLIPSFFYTRTYNKDIDASNWDEGLYNYNDVGMGLDFEMKGMDSGNASGMLKLGTQFYNRQYPNYTSLLDIVSNGELSFEEDEKDYNGIIARAGYSSTKEVGLSWFTDYSLLYKMLDDKKVVNADGTPSAENQRDIQHTLAIELLYTLRETLKLDLEVMINIKDSNQNYYDGIGTSPLNDDVFTPGFYNFNAYTIKPGISYILKDLQLTASLFGFYERTDYSNRRAKEAGGAYKTSRQWETLNKIYLDLMYEIPNHEKWNILCRIEHINFNSNNEYEAVYNYDYTVKNYALGVSYKY